VSAARTRLKFVTRFAYGEALPTDELQDGPIPVFGSNGQFASFPRANTRSPAIIVGRKGSYGKVNWTDEACFASDTTFVVDERTTSHHLRWIYWLLQALELDTGSDEAAVPGLNRDKAYEREVLLPDYGTQEATASFLDFEAQAVDTLIEAKQKLLGLLAEKRRTLVAEAVMRGLDRSSPLRPSGIDWLGDVPAHWDSVPLRFLVSFMGGATPDTKKEEYWNGEIPWVSPKDMKRDFIADSEDHISDLALANSALKMIDEEAVLIVVRGMILAHSFPTAINTVPVTINQDMKALRCDERISPRFLKVVLEGATQYLVDQADSSAHGTKKLETGVLGGLGIPVPPLEEQEQIIARIAEERVKIDKLATATERSIGLLKERRSALIAAAVTGQIAIPEAA
jgi:type I restriction enzyme S subunit